MKIFIALVASISAASAFAFPEAPFDALKTKVPKIKNSLNAYNYEGIVKLSNCSGSLIRFAGQPLSSNAYVLTNGHCLGRPFLKPGEAVANKAVARVMKVANREGEYFPVIAKKLVYGTMTGTDAAIYELEQTYDDILKLGIAPLDFDSTRPLVGMPIEVISGYWERGYTCSIDGFVFQLLEAGWTFTDSIRYSEPGCDTIGGTSGSPILEKDTRVVIGINNTSNESGQECTMNNPCEVDENGETTIRSGYSYGQQTYNFYTCLTPDFRIDTNLDSCELTKP